MFKTVNRFSLDITIRKLIQRFMENKKIFEEYIKKNFKERCDTILAGFNLYHSLLLDANKKINLVSRKTLEDDFWTIHYLDSILPAEYFDFNDKNVLDFGTGGGLPGIPLRIIFPKMRNTFLDSRSKKINIISEIVDKMNFENCFYSKERLEDFQVINYENKFDVIVSRSVKMNEVIKNSLPKLIKKNGELILYKSRNIDDLKIFKDYKIYDVTKPEIGKRLIVEIKKI